MALIGVLHSGLELLLELDTAPFSFVQLFFHHVVGAVFDSAATAAGPESLKQTKVNLMISVVTFVTICSLQFGL